MGKNGSTTSLHSLSSDPVDTNLQAMRPTLYPLHETRGEFPCTGPSIPRPFDLKFDLHPLAAPLAVLILDKRTCALSPYVHNSLLFCVGPHFEVLR